jgi:hypothetical protein
MIAAPAFRFLRIGVESTIHNEAMGPATACTSITFVDPHLLNTGQIAHRAASAHERTIPVKVSSCFERGSQYAPTPSPLPRTSKTTLHEKVPRRQLGRRSVLLFPAHHLPSFSAKEQPPCQFSPKIPAYTCSERVRKEEP